MSLIGLGLEDSERNEEGFLFCKRYATYHTRFGAIITLHDTVTQLRIIWY